MILRINKNGSLKAIQQQFNLYYPFLKIEFFKKESADKSIAKSSVAFEPEFQQKLNGFADHSVNIDVSRKRSIAEIEKDFDRLLSLSVRVFRRSGNVWVETSLTNEWSLEDQNEEAKQISSHFKRNEG
jgi:hypothetical protein